MLQAQNSQRQTEKKLGKKCRELEILGKDAGAVVVQTWAGPGEQTTGKKALVSNWTHSSPLAPSRLFLSLSYTMIQGWTLCLLIPTDQPQAGGKDTMSANGLHPNHFALTWNSRLPFLKGFPFTLQKHPRTCHFFDLHNSPCMLRLLFV